MIIVNIFYIDPIYKLIIVVINIGQETKKGYFVTYQSPRGFLLHNDLSLGKFSAF